MRHQGHQHDISGREQRRDFARRTRVEEGHIREPAGAHPIHQVAFRWSVAHQHKPQRDVCQQGGGIEHTIQSLREPVQPGVERDARVGRLPGERCPSLGGTPIGMEGLAVHPVRQMVGAAPRKPAGNILDGESNAAEPLSNPTFPTGNGVPGGDFTARFTIDTTSCEVGPAGAAA